MCEERGQGAALAGIDVELRSSHIAGVGGEGAQVKQTLQRRKAGSKNP